jgi:aspartyl-tRNA(Asn)/glutamyl-tRNA(Gln) amidotransferase subunit C
MDALSRDDVEEIALLARLALRDDEIERMRTDLAAILSHMDQLRAVDTSGIEPMTHAVPMELRLREDAVAPSLPVEVALSDAPDRAVDFFQVPHIIKSGAGEAG